MFDFIFPLANAQTTAESPAANPFGSLVFLAVIFIIFFFITIRPQMKRAKEHREMLAALKSGDEVVTQGGILGKVSEIKDSAIEVQVASNVKINIQKHAIAALLPKGTLKN